MTYQKHTNEFKLEAVPIPGDSLRHEPRWQSKAMADLLAGTYHLRLHLDNAEVFAIVWDAGA